MLTLGLLAAAMWLLVGVWRLYMHGGSCLACGGLGDHRRDCPLRRD